jgi:hypothetical protein
MPRRPIPGMLLHIDASQHRWFQDDRQMNLTVMLDDATSEFLLTTGRAGIHPNGHGGDPLRRGHERVVFVVATYAGTLDSQETQMILAAESMPAYAEPWKELSDGDRIQLVSLT